MSKKLTYDYVKNYIENEGYSLVSKEYINNRDILSVKCDNGHIYNTSFGNFKASCRCPKCRSAKLSVKFSMDYNHIKSYIESYEYSLISNNYKNAHDKIDIMCNNGHIYKAKFNNFQQGQRCPECKKVILSNLKINSYEFVKNYIEYFNYKLISDTYVGASTKLKLICPMGHEYNVSFNSFKNQNNRCLICWCESKSSRAESYIQNFVSSLGVDIIRNDRTQIVNPLTGHNLELDVWIPSIKKAIEYNGTYWHSLNIKQINDKIKKEQCEKLDIDLMIVNEHNWNINRSFELDRIKQFVLET